MRRRRNDKQITISTQRFGNHSDGLSVAFRCRSLVGPGRVLVRKPDLHVYDPGVFSPSPEVGYLPPDPAVTSLRLIGTLSQRCLASIEEVNVARAKTDPSHPAKEMNVNETHPGLRLNADNRPLTVVLSSSKNVSMGFEEPAQRLVNALLLVILYIIRIINRRHFEMSLFRLHGTQQGGSLGTMARCSLRGTDV